MYECEYSLHLQRSSAPNQGLVKYLDQGKIRHLLSGLTTTYEVRTLPQLFLGSLELAHSKLFYIRITSKLSRLNKAQWNNCQSMRSYIRIAPGR